MTIRARFAPLIGVLLGVLASGASWPANAEPHLSSDGTSEFLAPVPSEDLGSPQASVEPISETRRESEPPSTGSVPDIDPWAYAFAESSRLQAVAFRGPVNVPVYEVAMNPQVEYFVDRFTSTRRDAVGGRRQGDAGDRLHRLLGVGPHPFPSSGDQGVRSGDPCGHGDRA